MQVQRKNCEYGHPIARGSASVNSGAPISFSCGRRPRPPSSRCDSRRPSLTPIPLINKKNTTSRLNQIFGTGSDWVPLWVPSKLLKSLSNSLLELWNLKLPSRMCAHVGLCARAHMRHGSKVLKFHFCYIYVNKGKFAEPETEPLAELGSDWLSGFYWGKKL